MITKEYMQKELARRIAGIRPNVPTNTDVLIGELKSVLVMVDCLPGEISEKPINPEEAMKELDEKIALVKQRGTWDGVDVDKYMDEVRGREPEKPMNQDGLDEEIERYLHSLGVGYGGWVDGMDDEDLRGIARHFAQWGADHTPLPEDTVLFNKGVAEGRRLEREENLDRDNVYWKGIQYAKEQMLKDGLDAVKTLDFNKAEKTIAGVFVKYGMDRQKEIMSNGDYEKIKRLLSIAFMNYLDFNRPFGKMCLSNGECKNIDDAFDNQDWSELCRYADKMLKMNELGNGPFDKDYRPSGIQNDLSEGQIKAVELKGGTIVTEKLAKAIEKKSLLEKTLFEKALAAYHEKLKELPPPPSGYYYAPKMGKIRQEGDQYICDGYISLEPIIKVEEK